MPNLWPGYKKEELLEATHGDSYRLEKSSVPFVSISLCTQGQSQITHEGKVRGRWQRRNVIHKVVIVGLNPTPSKIQGIENRVIVTNSLCWTEGLGRESSSLSAVCNKYLLTFGHLPVSLIACM